MKTKAIKQSGRFFLLWLAGMLLTVQAFAQEITVNGNVKDNLGETVIGASVVIKGTTNGTITDFDGNFSLKAKERRHHCNLVHRLQDTGTSCCCQYERGSAR